MAWAVLGSGVCKHVEWKATEMHANSSMGPKGTQVQPSNTIPHSSLDAFIFPPQKLPDTQELFQGPHHDSQGTPSGETAP